MPKWVTWNVGLFIIISSFTKVNRWIIRSFLQLKNSLRCGVFSQILCLNPTKSHGKPGQSGVRAFKVILSLDSIECQRDSIMHIICQLIPAEFELALNGHLTSRMNRQSWGDSSHFLAKWIGRKHFESTASAKKAWNFGHCLISK